MENTLNICNKCRKRTDESAFSYKSQAGDKCTGATGQYYRDKQKVLTIKNKSHVRNVVQCVLGCGWNFISIAHFVSIMLCWRKLKQLSL